MLTIIPGIVLVQKRFDAAVADAANPERLSRSTSKSRRDKTPRMGYNAILQSVKSVAGRDHAASSAICATLKVEG